MKKLFVIAFVLASFAVSFSSYAKELNVCARFTDEFVSKYKYEDSKNFRFALFIKQGNKWDWFYYNVYRNKNNGMSNDRKRWLTWAISAYEFKKWYCWVLPIGVKVKVSSKDYRYIYKILEDKVYTSDDFRTSGVKEWVIPTNMYIKK